jgi:hypothetical protein
MSERSSKSKPKKIVFSIKPAINSVFNHLRGVFPARKGYTLEIDELTTGDIKGTSIVDTELSIIISHTPTGGKFILWINEKGFSNMGLRHVPFISEDIFKRDASRKGSGISVDCIKENDVRMIYITGEHPSYKEDSADGKTHHFFECISRYSSYDASEFTLDQIEACIKDFCEKYIISPMLWNPDKAEALKRMSLSEDSSYYFGTFVPGTDKYRPENAFMLTSANVEQVFAKYAPEAVTT